MSVELLQAHSNRTETALDSPDWTSTSVSIAVISGMAVLLAVLCACLLGARLAKMASACWFELPLPATEHIPYRCSQPQAVCGVVEPCLMADRGAAALSEEHRTLAQSAQRDTELGLPPALPLPDGEEFPHSANRVHIRSADQEKEIYQACIRPPPNRTVSGRQLSPPMSVPVAPSAPRAGRFIANCAKSRPLRLETRKASDSTVIPPTLTVIVPKQRAGHSVASTPRPKEREVYQSYVRPPQNRTASGRQPAPPVAPSIASSVAPPVTRPSRRQASDTQPGRAASGRRASGRLAARAAAAAAGLFSRQ